MNGKGSEMRYLKFIAIQFAVLLLAAYSASAASGKRGVSEKFEKSYAITTGGAVSLENVNGNVKVTTWDKNEVRIEAFKSADSREALDRLKIEVDASGKRVEIHTRYPRHEDGGNGHDMSVNYVLTVPKGVSLDRIRTVNGQVDIAGVQGDVTVSTVNGPIETDGLKGSCELKTVNGRINAEFSALPSGQEVNLKSVNGVLTLGLPDNANANIKASTTVGRISSDFGLEKSGRSASNSFVRVGESLRGKLGNGGTRVTLETVNGSIDIVKSIAHR